MTSFALLTTAVLIAGVSAAFASDLKGGDDSPKYWRAILGDICQLPSFPRATADPTRYVECVRQSTFNSDRKDLGIWLLRECLPGYEFVASARRCKTAGSVEKQQELCDSANATAHDFCPPDAGTAFTVEEIREAPKPCACPNGETNCVCPSPEILAPTAVAKVPVNSDARRRSPQVGTTMATHPPQMREPGRLTFSQFQNCPCPQAQPQCYCIQLGGGPQNEPVLASSTCCPAQPAQNPCACAPSQLPAGINCQTTSTQQQYCPVPQQQPVVQPQACPLVQGGVQNAQYQGICSWMVDPLATDPQSRTHYLQCQPAPNNLFCGRWQRMPCAPATIFDVNAQVCVWDTTAQPGTVPPLQQQPQYNPSSSGSCSCTGGVQIGSCNANYQCPGQSVCQVGQQNGNPCMVCCYFRKKARVL